MYVDGLSIQHGQKLDWKLRDCHRSTHMSQRIPIVGSSFRYHVLTKVLTKLHMLVLPRF